MNLLGLDIETTGFYENANILSIYMQIFDENFKPCEFKHLKLKPNPDANGRTILNLEMESLQVTNIDLIKHFNESITYKDSRKIIIDWIKGMYDKYEDITPFGNGVSGDIKKIQDDLVGKGVWDKHISRMPIELTTLGKTLKFRGKIPATQSLALCNIARFFNLDVEQSRLHTEDYDVFLGAKILEKYLELLEK